MKVSLQKIGFRYFLFKKENSKAEEIKKSRFLWEEKAQKQIYFYAFQMQMMQKIVFFWSRISDSLQPQLLQVQSKLSKLLQTWDNRHSDTRLNVKMLNLPAWIQKSLSLLLSWREKVSFWIILRLGYFKCHSEAWKTLVHLNLMDFMIWWESLLLHG